MATRHCDREEETIRAAWSAEFAGFDEDLAAHLAECPGCAEIAAMARLFHDDRRAAVAGAHPPSAGIVWWRAQRRAREEAARRAARPISFVHGIALGSGTAAALAILAFGLDGLRRALATLGDLFSSAELPAVGWPASLTALPYGALLLLAAMLVLAPVAIYLAVGEE